MPLTSVARGQQIRDGRKALLNMARGIKLGDDANSSVPGIQDNPLDVVVCVDLFRSPRASLAHCRKQSRLVGEGHRIHNVPVQDCGNGRGRGGRYSQCMLPKTNPENRDGSRFCSQAVGVGSPCVGGSDLGVDRRCWQFHHTEHPWAHLSISDSNNSHAGHTCRYRRTRTHIICTNADICTRVHRHITAPSHANIPEQARR